MKYQHIKCDACGGIIGMYDRDNFTCEKCGKTFQQYKINCDTLQINNKTGWIFPMTLKGGVV